ncbi:MAG: efflux transporter outer membrane subunit [Tepidisphaera sp.]
MNRSSTTAALSAAALALLAGCTVGPEYAKPGIEIPGSFTAGQEISANIPRDDSKGAPPQPAQLPVASTADLANWWTTMGDETLTGLIGSALQANHDIRLAVARLDESRALVGIARAERGVQIDADGRFSRSRGSETTTNGSRFQSDVDDEFRAGVSASWEVDFFGRVRRSVQAARADLDAAEASVNDAHVLIAADVAQRYVELRGAQQRLEVNRRAIAVREQTLDLSKALLKTGLAAEFDVAQAEAELASRRAASPVFEAQIRQNAHALAVLCGKSAADLLELTTASGPIPVPPASLALGVPADLLMRRPDLRRAERQLAAATARIGVATADLYPRFSLLGSFAMESANAGDFADLDSRSYSFGPSVTWSVFNNGRVKSNIDAADARTTQSLIAYEQAVLVAIREAEDALVGLSSERTRLDSLQTAVKSNERAVELAESLFKTGLSALTPVLDNQRRLYDAEDQAAQSRTAVATSAVAVYKALGGGWQPREPRKESRQ